MSEIREALLTFVRAAQAPEETGLYSVGRRIARAVGESAWLSLSFGKGYFDPSKVLVYLDDGPRGEAETEEAVSAYCEGRVPRCEVPK